MGLQASIDHLHHPKGGRNLVVKIKKKVRYAMSNFNLLLPLHVIDFHPRLSISGGWPG